MFCGAEEAWLCPSCWLLADASANPFRALDVEEAWILQLAAFAEQRPPDLSRLLLLCEEQEEPWGPTDDVPGGCVAVLWDGQDRACALVASALLHAFGSRLVKLIDFRNRVALDAVLAKHPGLPWAPLCRQGGVSAILQTGIFITGCEKHPKVLLYELKYRRNVTPAPPETAPRLQRTYLEPLAALRKAASARAVFGGGPLEEATSPGEVGQWWRQPAALEVISRALAFEKFVVVDGFLLEADFEQLRCEAEALARHGELHRGNRGGGPRVEEDAADLLNTCNRPRKWTMWDDNLAYCGDDDPRAPAVGAILTRSMDALVDRLRVGGEGVLPAVSERLKGVLFREKTMVACYRAETCGQYFQHIDSAGGEQRRLTLIFYLNPGWTSEDGGFNRMYHEGWFNTSVKADILPSANRLLAFWADEDCPHEVTACPRRDRYAMTVWYAHGPTLLRGRLGSPHGEAELLADFLPARPYSFLDAALLADPHLPGDPRLLAGCAAATAATAGAGAP